MHSPVLEIARKEVDNNNPDIQFYIHKKYLR